MSLAWITAFPDVGISFSESKLCIQARHVSAFHTVCFPSAGLCPPLSPLIGQCSQSGNSAAAACPLLLFLNIANIYFQQFSKWTHFSQSLRCQFCPCLVICSSCDGSWWAVSASAAELALGVLCSLGYWIPIEPFGVGVSQDLTDFSVSDHCLGYCVNLGFLGPWEES